MFGCTAQALIKVYARGASATGITDAPLSEAELQEGLTAGFGARARRKHLQRLAAKSNGAGTPDTGSTRSEKERSLAGSGSDEQPESLAVPNVQPLASANGGELERRPQRDPDLAIGADVGVRPKPEAAVDGDVSTGLEPETAVDADFSVRGSRPEAAGHLGKEVGSGGHLWHGRRVVEKAMQRGGEGELCELMARFRQCFVDALQPKHLSPAWQVDHR